MGRRDHSGRGGKRRTVLQLNDTGSSYLARYGYSRSEEINNKLENNSAGANRLANLVGQYSSSSSEDEDEKPMPVSNSKVVEAPSASSTTDSKLSSPRPPASIPTPALAPKSSMVPQETAEGEKDIDDEVANFLAEIESLSTSVPDSASEVESHHLAPTPPILNREASPKPVKEELQVNRDGRGLGYRPDATEEAEAGRKPSSSKAYGSMFVKGEPEFTNKDATITKKNGKVVIKADSERIQEKEEEEEDVPDVPVSVWQQCLDENTKYYYYWNTLTNEVTWEIPPEYTQYLLLFREYEERMARIPEDKKLRKQQRDAEKAKAKSSNSKEKPQSSEASNREGASAASKGEPMVGPQLPSTPWGPHLPPGGPPPEADLPPSQPSAEPDLSKEEDSPAVTYGPALPPSTSEASVGGASATSAESDLAVQEWERSFLESTKLKMKKRRQEKSKADSSSPGGSASSSQVETPVTSDAVSQSSSVVETKSSKPVEEEEEDMELFDEEDIDRALELALERKRAELREMEEQEEPEKPVKQVIDYHHSHASLDPPATDSMSVSTTTSTATAIPHPPVQAALQPAKFEYHHKRPIVEADSASRDSLEAEAPAAKMPRLSLVAYDNFDDDDDASENEEESNQSATEAETKPDVSSSTSVVEAEKIEPKTESQILVTELVDILYGKLEFLEVTKKSLSKLQRLLIELDTRFSDWKGGFLDTDYFLQCLAEANGLLRQYEAGAAPDGWSCHWDRDFRRYYYTNSTTGVSQWDYPDEEEPTGGAGDSVSSSTTESTRQESHKPTQLSPKASTSTTSQQSTSSSEVPVVKAGKSDPDQKEGKPSSPLVSVYPGEPPPPGTVPAYAGLAIPPPPPPPPEPSPGEGDEYACDSNEDIDGVQMSPDRSSPGHSSADMESENEADSTQTSELQAGSAVIAKPPQLHFPTSSSTTATPLVPAALSSAPDTTLPPPPEVAEVGQGDSLTNLPTSSNSITAPSHGASEGEKKEKKKKKDKMASSSLSLKKKNVSSLVQKWKQVRQEVEQEEKVQEDRQRDIQMKLEEWRK